MISASSATGMAIGPMSAEADAADAPEAEATVEDTRKIFIIV